MRTVGSGGRAAIRAPDTGRSIRRALCLRLARPSWRAGHAREPVLRQAAANCDLAGARAGPRRVSTSVGTSATASSTAAIAKAIV